MSSQLRRQKLRQAQAERRRIRKSQGLCGCGKTRRVNGRTCEDCYLKGRNERASADRMSGPRRARPPLSYSRLVFVAEHETIAEFSDFCLQYGMRLHDLFHDAIEAYMEWTREIERREKKLAQDSEASEVLRDYLSKAI